MMGLVKYIGRWMYPSGSERTVLRGPLQGTKFVACPAMRARYALGVDAWNESFFDDKINADDVVFEVGANRGQLTLLFAQRVTESGKVVAFEPIRENVEALRKNLSLNSLDNVRIVNAAASSGEGVVNFKYEGARSRKIVNVGENNSCRKASTTTIDKIARQHNAYPDIMKIDVEGGGKSVLEGAQRVLNKNPNIFIEVHNEEERVAVEQEVLGKGYTIKTPEGKTITKSVSKNVRHLWCEYRH